MQSLWLANYGKESDHTDASVNKSADVLVNTSPTHYRHVGRHTMDASADTLATRQSTLYWRIGWNTPFLTVILLYFSAGSKTNFIRKDKNVKTK